MMTIKTRHDLYLGAVWIRHFVRPRLQITFRSFFFFFFFVVQPYYLTKSTVNSAQMHCSWISQISRFIKNGSHSTIHTFKNYFATVFSVSIFNFSKNKLNPNGPLVPH